MDETTAKALCIFLWMFTAIALFVPFLELLYSFVSWNIENLDLFLFRLTMIGVATGSVSIILFKKYV